MIKYKEFKGAAYGVLNSFISRNNDIGGYWAMGKLHKHSLENNLTEININLLTQQVTPDNPAFQKMVNKYYDLFITQCEKRSLPCICAVEANIILKFSLNSENLKINPQYTHARGTPFQAIVKIKDDLGRIHTAQIIGRCAPHDPKTEHRSSRK